MFFCSCNIYSDTKVHDFAIRFRLKDFKHYHRPHHLHRYGEHNGGATLCCNGVQGLQVAQLEGSGSGYGVCSLLQSP